MQPYCAAGFLALEFLGSLDGVLIQMYNSIGSSTDSSGDGDFVDGFLVDFGIQLNDEIGGSRNTATYC
jgi:hypothetical protein